MTSLLSADFRQDPANPDLTALLCQLDTMVASVEPAVVFTSVVRLCVPLICDVATVTMIEPDQDPYAISWPREATDQDNLDPALTVLTRITGPPTAEHTEYCGTLTLQSDSLPARELTVLAQLVVDRATALVHRERLTELVDTATTRAANLSVALQSNRSIGVAIGIVMSLHKVTEENAFEELREVSQRTHRKLREVAFDVTETGTIQEFGDLASLRPGGAERGRREHPVFTPCPSSSTPTRRTPPGPRL